MAGEIRINTDEVAMAATSIEEINKKLNEKIKKKKTVDNNKSG